MHRYHTHPPRCSACQDTGSTPGGDCACPNGQRYTTEFFEYAAGNFTNGKWVLQPGDAALGELRDDNAHDADVLDFCDQLEYLTVGQGLVFDAGASGRTKFTRIS